MGRPSVVGLVAWPVGPREAGADSVREGWKIAGTVALIGLLGADIGLQTVRVFGSSGHQQRADDRSEQPNPDAGQPQTHTPLASPSYQTSGPERAPAADARQPEYPTQNSTGRDIWMILQGLSAPFVAAFTGVLVFVACLQLKTYMKQAAIMRRQVRISARQAEIAQRQIDVVERLERPLLLPMMPSFFLGFASNPRHDFPPIEFGLKNHGRSPAIISKTIIVCLVSTDAPPLHNEDDRFVRIERPERQTVGRVLRHWSNPAVSPGEHLGPIDLTIGRPLTQMELDGVEDGTCFVWVDGHIIYTDMFGAKREMLLLWRYDRRLDIMIPSEIAGRNRYT
jgi:hypothetical protein